jgi:hypothetical protein
MAAEVHSGVIVFRLGDVVGAHLDLKLPRDRADSDEGGRLFRLKADSVSDRLRTPFR